MLQFLGIFTFDIGQQLVNNILESLKFDAAIREIGFEIGNLGFSLQVVHDVGMKIVFGFLQSLFISVMAVAGCDRNDKEGNRKHQ